MEEEPAAAVNRIRRIAEDLDVDHLNEEELRALSEAALGLVVVAKVQQARSRDISLHRSQVDDWETRNAEAVAGAEMATDALAALRTRIDEGGMDRKAVSAALDRIERWLSVDARYRVTHEKFEQASEKLRQVSGDSDFQSVRSLTDTLEALAAERSQAWADVDAAVTKPESGRLDTVVGEPRLPSEPEPTERADSPDELNRPADQPAPSTAVLGEGITESARKEDLAGSNESGVRQRRAALDRPKRPDDDEPRSEEVDEPARSNDAEHGSVEQIEDTIATLIEGGRLGLAYHLSLGVRRVPKR